jgi:GNAT superfamily N-acetyltransferase
MTTNPTFRDARLGDVPAILALSDAGAPPGSERRADPGSYADPRYAAAFAAIDADPAHRLIVAESDGEIVGTLQISIIPGLPNFGLARGLLENVHVRPDQRGKGLGTAMMGWAIAYCRERGCGLVQLTSNKARSEAHRFYEALGFVKSHEGFKLRL